MHHLLWKWVYCFEIILKKPFTFTLPNLNLKNFVILQETFYPSYREVHGYISVMICILGTVANILNIIVLTRKEMISSPINRILTGADIICLKPNLCLLGLSCLKLHI